jgi:hypothetical protein
MKKISENLENPIDNLFYNISNMLSPYFKQIYFTPNMITSLSNIICLFSIYFIIKKQFIFAGILYIISYYFDCLDGFYARKYNMTSKFGKYYDSFSDIIKLILILFFIRKYFSIYRIIIFIILGILYYLHVNCTNKLIQEYHPINIPELCLEEPDKMLKYTKYLGGAGFNIGFAIIIATLGIKI